MRRRDGINPNWRKCGICGRFVSYADMDSGDAVIRCEPDNIMADSPSEDYYWNHVACEMKEIGGSPR